MMLNHYQSGHALTHLLVGKTALAYLPVLEELVNRNILKTPQYITDSFYSVKPIDPILSYLVNCLQ